MLDNISGYQVDKVKFAMECDPAVASLREVEFASAIGALTGPQGGKAYNVQSVKKGEVYGTYLYVFDVWGEAAMQVESLDFASWYPHLDRVDLKTTMPMTPDGMRNYYDFLKELTGGNRSIDLRQSPIRQKRGNRDAGGHTLSLGSHKSDFRAHWTLRGREDGYQEFQLQGTRLSVSIGATNHWMRHPEEQPDRITWKGLMRSILIGAQADLTDIDGLYDTDRAAILSGRTDVHGVMERKLAQIDREIQTLPKDALYALMRTIEDKVFGEVPTSITGIPVTRMNDGLEEEEV